MQHLLFLVLFVPLQLFAQSNCLLNQTENLNTFECSQIYIQQEALSPNKDFMKIIFSDGFSMELTVKKSTKGFTPLFSFNLGHRSQTSINDSDAFLIETTIQELNKRNLIDSFNLIEFFKEIPTNVPLDYLTQPSGEVPWPSGGGDEDKDKNPNKPSQPF